MVKKSPEAKGRESGDFRRLKKAGFEMRPPEDEFSFQPDSGSAMGGKIGADEYGITGGIAGEQGRTQPVVEPPNDVLTPDPRPIGEVEEGFPGVSEWSRDHSTGEEEEKRPSPDFNRPDEKIQQAMRERLDRHRAMHRIGEASDIRFEVDHGKLRLFGKVHKDAEKVLVEEIAEAIPGVKEVENDLRVEL